jgi:FKBP-type peptidyl-prolyl cis-trans isomerase FklB
MNKFIALFGVLFSLNATAQVKPKVPVKKPVVAKSPVQKLIIKTDDDSLSYAIGVSVGDMMTKSDVTDISGPLMKKGIEEALAGKPHALDPNATNTVLQKHMEFCSKIKEAGTKLVALKPTPVKPGKPPVMVNQLDSFSYAAGINIGGNMKSQGYSSINGTLLEAGAVAVIRKQPTLITIEKANMKLQEKMQAYMTKKKAEEKAKGNAFLTANKERKEVTTLENGLQYEVLRAGSPDSLKPGPADQVTVHYVGTFIDGIEFDGSVKRGQPITFPVNGVIKGWTQILQMMTKGSKWKVFIPSDLAYGDGGNNGIPPGATLIFEIDLIDITKAK